MVLWWMVTHVGILLDSGLHRNDGSGINCCEWDGVNS